MNKSKDNKNIKYPRFISNKPCGIDKFEGKSQEKLTNAIANHIVFTDSDNNTQNLSRIIGLEGGWGVGKSNVIKQIKTHRQIIDNYCLFEYDAWGHQEDLQRRSFLEILTAELIENNLLSGDTEINIKGGETRQVSWNEKLKYLLARKTETSTEKRPKLSVGIIAFVLAAIFTSIFASIADTLKDNCLLISIILPFVPFVLAAIVVLYFLRKRNKDWKDIFNEIFSIYNGKIENERSYETISEEEPTVTEFKNWLQSISDHLDKDSKKLIIVYDNMDRLPAEKVKELWSSIHTFFSESSFDNVWAIIPFDEKHLSCAFGESDNREQLTKYFISKTFPVVYRVTPPVITDFKEIFDTLFLEAFDNSISEEQKDLINRIFRLETPNATVREIIEFINQLVALKNIWQDEVDILLIAIFVLKKENVLSNPVEQILSGEYLGKHILNIVSDDENLRKGISALVYGVSLEIAEQIPMTKYLDSCFNKEENTDINKFANSTNFIRILKDKVKSSDIAQLDNIIQCLGNLDVSNFSENDKKEITALWNTLAQRKMATPLLKQDIENNHKHLIKNTDDNHKKDIIKYICEQIQSFKDFNGKDYFGVLERLDGWIKRKEINVNIIDYLIDLEKNPEVFVDYVLCAKEKYLLYRLIVKPDIFVKYLSDRVTDQYSVLEVLKYLKNNKKFQFNPVKVKIEETIQNQQLIEEKNFKPLFDAYKILSEEKPLKIQINPTQRQNIWNVLASKPNTPEYLEIVAIQIANGVNTGGTFDEDQIKNIATQMDYYAKYGELLINNLSWNIPILSQALKYMTENKLGYILSLEKVLPKFFEIKSNLGISEITLLEQFNDWKEHKLSITRENIQSIFKDIPQFFQNSVATKNDLTDYLNKTIVEALSNNVSADTLHQKRPQPNYYWNVILKILIDTDYLRSLPDNLTDLGKKYLDDIAASRLAIPNANDIVYKIIEKIDRRKTKETITHIRNQICNNIAGYTIDANKFIFLNEWLEKQGDLSSRAGDVCQYILNPVVNNVDCLNTIIQNADFYANIINLAEAQADTFKSSICNKLSTSTDVNLISFAEKIEVEKEKQYKL